MEKDTVDFQILDHQKEAVVNTDKIYESGRRVAGDKMPTGGGKSFVAMQEILKAGNNDYLSKDVNGVVNNANIIYVAPTNEILFQIQSNIVEFILKKDINNLSIEECKDAIKKAFSSNDASTILKKDEDSIRKNGIKALVRIAFPNLELKCYQTLIKKHEEGSLKDLDPDLVILDEVHRSGAIKSQAAVAELLGCNIKNGEPVYNPNNKKKSKVLAISATPERDVDSKNMMDLWASALDNLTKEQIDNKEHIGLDLDLDTAVRKNIVVEPEVIHFDANLAFSDDYKRLVELYNISRGTKQKQLEERLEKVNEQVIGVKGFHKLSQKEQEEFVEKQNLKVMAEAYKSGKIPKHGKMIMFIPHNIEKDGVKPETGKFLENKENFIRNMMAETGFNVNVSSLSSYYNDDQNEVTLNKFNTAFGKDSESDFDFEIIISSDKLNEGVHVKGITNSFMERKIQEGVNTNQRAQTILFLQQIGRTVYSIMPNEDPKPRPVIFDFGNNFYTQNRENPRKDKISIFKLTESQKILLEAARFAEREISSKALIQYKLPRLIDTLKILKEYGFEPTLETIDENTELQDLLEKPPLSEKKDEVLERLEETYLYSKDAKYKIGKDYVEANKKIWNGVKSFENYDLQTLIDCGIIDINSEKGKDILRNAQKKGLLDLDSGFIKSGITDKFKGYNLYTGKTTNKEGLTKDGINPELYDEVTGLDPEGYNMRGFNSEGIHKETGTIHNPRGFMADGTNILTGTEYDMLGYDYNGIRPVKVSRSAFERVKASKNKKYITSPDKRKHELMPYDIGTDEDTVIIGGWDKDHKWHEAVLTEEGEVKFFTNALGNYTTNTKPSIDEYGFQSTKSQNIYTKNSSMDRNRYWKDGKCDATDHRSSQDGKYHCYPEYLCIAKVYGTTERDFDGNFVEEIYFDRDNFERDHGFSLPVSDGQYADGAKIPQNIHKETGTRFDPKGKSVSYYHKKAKEIRELERKGRLKHQVEAHKSRQFNEKGINIITGEYEDMYGFTILDYMAAKRGLNPCNKYGKSIKDIPSGNLVDKHPNEIYDKRTRRNVLGTNEFGEESNRKLHPSLELAKTYVEECMKNGMTLDEFTIKIAKEQKKLVPEAQQYIKTSLNQAAFLARTCRGLMRKDSSQKVMQMFNRASAEKKKEFFDMCPGLEHALREDLSHVIQEKEKTQNLIDENKNLKNRKEQLIKKAKPKTLEVALKMDDGGKDDIS